MSVRSDLAAIIQADAPATWEIHHVPRRLRTFLDPEKEVAIVLEQRGLTTQRFSSDGVEIPVEVSLSAWVIVDASRGDDGAEIEDRLEAAAETMIRILEPLADTVWDGTAERTAYDEQKPAYQFPLRFAGSITQEAEE